MCEFDERNQEADSGSSYPPRCTRLQLRLSRKFVTVVVTASAAASRRRLAVAGTVTRCKCVIRIVILITTAFATITIATASTTISLRRLLLRLFCERKSSVGEHGRPRAQLARARSGLGVGVTATATRWPGAVCGTSSGNATTSATTCVVTAQHAGSGSIPARNALASCLVVGVAMAVMLLVLLELCLSLLQRKCIVADRTRVPGLSGRRRHIQRYPAGATDTRTVVPVSTTSLVATHVRLQIAAAAISISIAIAIGVAIAIALPLGLAPPAR